MSFLRDSEILGLVNGGELISHNFNEKNITPNGYDLTIASVKIDGGEKEIEYAKIPPGKVFWVSTVERVSMPSNIGGELWIRSSYARKGVFGSFGFVDAGFRGTLTLSFFNGSSASLEISRGDRIAQLTFVRLDGNAESTYEKRSGNYQNQEGIRL